MLCCFDDMDVLWYHISKHEKSTYYICQTSDNTPFLYKIRDNNDHQQTLPLFSKQKTSKICGAVSKFREHRRFFYAGISALGIRYISSKDATKVAQNTLKKYVKLPHKFMNTIVISFLWDAAH